MVEVVTDHKPLIPIYNSATKPKQLRVNSHRTKLLPFQYTVVYEPGKQTPCDYGSRHPTKRRFTQEEHEKWCIDDGSEIFVNRIMQREYLKQWQLKSWNKQQAKTKTCSNWSNVSKIMTLISARNISRTSQYLWWTHWNQWACYQRRADCHSRVTTCWLSLIVTWRPLVCR